jgi:hypothetical protein
VVLTADTRLIGMPTQTMDGIMVKCLLNPLLLVNGRIKLDNASIQLAAQSPAYRCDRNWQASRWAFRAAG